MENNKLISQRTYSLVSLMLLQHVPTAFFVVSKKKIFSIAAVTCFVIFINTVAFNANASPDDHMRPNNVGSSLHKQGQSRYEKPRSWAKGRILVMPRAGLPAQAFTNILKEHDGRARKIGQSNLYIVDIPEHSEENVIAHLEHHPHLKFAELDYSALPSFIPNDPYYPNGWHLPKIGAPDAWDYSQGTGITIAILDSGVNGTHPDLAAQMVSGWNFFDNNSNTSDVYGHGTAVAGAAAATSNNGIGVASVAGQSSIMPIRITDTAGVGYYSMIAQGLTYAADHGARVANVSFLDISSSASTRSAAQYMKDKNGLVVVAGGNTGKMESYAVTTTMIPVSNTDENDVLRISSSYGYYIALSAPGKGIWSTTMEGDYNMFGGTSISSPVTAGTIALMMSANPKLNSLDIENLLYSTAVDLGDPGRDIYFGYGRIDTAAAVKAAFSTTPSLDTESPIASIIEPLEGTTVAGLVPVDINASDNIGVTRAELWVNGSTVAVDDTIPFAFSWDTSGTPNGATNLAVYVFDAAGNKTLDAIEVNVENTIPLPLVDIEPPIITIANPVSGNVSGSVTISTDASDNNGAIGITQFIYIDDLLVAQGAGSTLAFNWNTRSKKIKSGMHNIKAVAKDSTGNTSTTSVSVKVIK